MASPFARGTWVVEPPLVAHRAENRRRHLRKRKSEVPWVRVRVRVEVEVCTGGGGVGMGAIAGLCGATSSRLNS